MRGLWVLPLIVGCSLSPESGSDVVSGQWGEPVQGFPDVGLDYVAGGPLGGELTINNLVRGQNVILTASGLAPGEEVIFFSGEQWGPGPCLGQFCMDLAGEILTLGSAVADQQGEAKFQVLLPNIVTVGIPLYFQGMIRDGRDSYFTPVAFGTVYAPCRDDAFEDDDGPSDAQDLPIGMSDVHWSCVFDADYYLVELLSGEGLQVEAYFRDGEGDVDVSVIDGSNGFVIGSGASTSANESVFARATHDGAYLVAVTLYADAGQYGGNRYVLESSIVPAPPACVADSLEPNDALTPAPITAGSYPDLTVCDVDNSDWYSLEVLAGDLITAALTFSNAEGDVDLYLYDPAGVEVTRSWTTDDNEYVEFEADVDGAWLIQVDLWSDVVLNEFGNTYQLDVSVN